MAFPVREQGRSLSQSLCVHGSTRTTGFFCGVRETHHLQHENNSAIHSPYTAVAISVIFCPPNPKLFDSTACTFCSRAVFGT